jgi:ParB/RepB/Spo0J family partition protein
MKKMKKTTGLATRAEESTVEEGTETPANTSQDLLPTLLSRIGETVVLPTSLLRVQGNIRQILDVTAPEFRQLVASVRQHGIKQNLIGDLRVGNDGQWEVICVAGQRRWLAAQEIGLETVPVRLEQYADATSLLVDSLSENILRQNLHCLDAALGYLRLLQFGWTPDHIAEAFERKRDTVMKMLRLARYPAAAQEVIRLYPEKFTSTVLLTKFVSKAWSSDQVLVAALQDFATRERHHPLRNTISDFEVKELEEIVLEKGLRLSAQGSKQQGRLTLSWASSEEFDEVKKMLSK